MHRRFREAIKGVDAGRYGVWYGLHHHRNFFAHVPAYEWQSISRGELQGLPHAMLGGVQGEHMVVVLESEYVYKGITIWSNNWHRYWWKISSGEVGHRDLWEHILWLCDEAGELLQLKWVPSDLYVEGSNVEGNEAADELTGQGREKHRIPYCPFLSASE